MNTWRQILAWEIERSIGTVEYVVVDDPAWDGDSDSDPQMRIFNPPEIRRVLEQLQANDVVIMADGRDFDRDELHGKTVMVDGQEVKIP